jgi:ParB family chromosome partitioning protein
VWALQNIPIHRIITSSESLRRIDGNAVEELAKSIRSNGLLQPILVRPSRGAYEVVFGNHRLQACKRLDWKTIPANIKELNEDESFLTQLTENIQRNVAINPLAEARGYVKLIEHGWTINSIAGRIGKSDSYVSDRVGLIRRLHPIVAGKVLANGRIKPSHCELIARIRSPESQVQLSELIERKGLSVRRLEQLLKNRQLFREEVKENGSGLYMPLPKGILEFMKIEKGSQAYVYPQTKHRLIVEIISTKEEQPTTMVA